VDFLTKLSLAIDVLLASKAASHLEDCFFNKPI